MYVKLFSSILDSSVWDEAPATRLVWITLLCLADEDGFVKGVEGAIARRAAVSPQECREALRVLEAPDLNSQDPSYGGRRIEKVEGGWLVLNYARYREYRTREQVKAADRQRRKYHKDKDLPPKRESREASRSSASASVPASGGASRSSARARDESSLAEQFSDETQRSAYEAYRRSHRMPDGFDATLRTVHEPPTGGVAFPWPVIGAALVEMRGASADFSAAALRGFCRRLTRPEAARTNGSHGGRQARNLEAIGKFLEGGNG